MHPLNAPPPCMVSSRAATGHLSCVRAAIGTLQAWGKPFAWLHVDEPPLSPMVVGKDPLQGQSRRGSSQIRSRSRSQSHSHSQVEPSLTEPSVEQWFCGARKKVASTLEELSIIHPYSKSTAKSRSPGAWRWVTPGAWRWVTPGAWRWVTGLIQLADVWWILGCQLVDAWWKVMRFECL